MIDFLSWGYVCIPEGVLHCGPILKPMRFYDTPQSPQRLVCVLPSGCPCLYPEGHVVTAAGRALDANGPKLGLKRAKIDENPIFATDWLSDS